jgi:hypothetical protein
VHDELTKLIFVFLKAAGYIDRGTHTITADGGGISRHVVAGRATAAESCGGIFITFLVEGCVQVRLIKRTCTYKLERF